MLPHFGKFCWFFKYPDTWIPMDKLSIIQVSMISNYPCIQLSKYPWYQLSMVSNYPSIHDIQVSMVSNYPDIRKKWYPLIPTCMCDWTVSGAHSTDVLTNSLLRWANSWSKSCLDSTVSISITRRLILPTLTSWVSSSWTLRLSVCKAFSIPKRTALLHKRWGNIPTRHDRNLLAR